MSEAWSLLHSPSSISRVPDVVFTPPSTVSFLPPYTPGTSITFEDEILHYAVANQAAGRDRNRPGNALLLCLHVNTAQQHTLSISGINASAGEAATRLVFRLNGGGLKKMFVLGTGTVCLNGTLKFYTVGDGKVRLNSVDLSQDAQETPPTAAVDWCRLYKGAYQSSHASSAALFVASSRKIYCFDSSGREGAIGRGKHGTVAMGGHGKDLLASDDRGILLLYHQADACLDLTASDGALPSGKYHWHASGACKVLGIDSESFCSIGRENVYVEWKVGESKPIAIIPRLMPNGSQAVAMELVNRVNVRIWALDGSIVTILRPSMRVTHEKNSMPVDFRGNIDERGAKEFRVNGSRGALAKGAEGCLLGSMAFPGKGLRIGLNEAGRAIVVGDFDIRRFNRVSRKEVGGTRHIRPVVFCGKFMNDLGVVAVQVGDKVEVKFLESFNVKGTIEKNVRDVAIGTDRVILADDSAFEVWEITGTLRCDFKVECECKSKNGAVKVDCSPDCSVVARSAGKFVEVWDVEDGSCLWGWGMNGDVKKVECWGDYVVACTDNEIRVESIESSTQLNGEIKDFCTDDDFVWVAVKGEDGEDTVWKIDKEGGVKLQASLPQGICTLGAFKGGVLGISTDGKVIGLGLAGDGSDVVEETVGHNSTAPTLIERKYGDEDQAPSNGAPANAPAKIRTQQRKRSILTLYDATSDSIPRVTRKFFRDYVSDSQA